MIDWTKIPNSEKLSPHFTVGEWTKGVPHSYLNTRKVDPLAPLAVATVAELARIEFGKLVDLLPDPARFAHPRGITISSGVRTPSTNGGAKKSRHMCGEDYIACDFRPQGNFKASLIEYNDFYGCWIRALDHCSEPFGLGYYPKTQSGIHIDCSFELRAAQHKSQITPWNESGDPDMNYCYIPRGYRWGQNYSFRGNQRILTSLHTSNHDSTIAPRPWIAHARELGVNLDLAKGKPTPHKCCK